MAYTNLYSPRGSRKLWPLGRTCRQRRLSFHPETTHWSGPSPQPCYERESFKENRRNKEKSTSYSVAALNALVEGLRKQAEETSREARKPSIQVLLGRVVEEKEAEGKRDSSKGIDSMVKSWDPKGKGEVAKAQMVRTALLAHAVLTSQAFPPAVHLSHCSPLVVLPLSTFGSASTFARLAWMSHQSRLTVSSTDGMKTEAALSISTSCV